MDNENVGLRIKQIRKEKKMTQKDLANEINRSVETIKKYENGSIEIPLTILQSIAKTLEIEITDLIGQPLTITYNEKEYLIEQLMNKLGYRILGDDTEGYLCLEYNGSEYEINELDLDKLYDSSISFLEFQLRDLIKRSRKIGK